MIPLRSGSLLRASSRAALALLALACPACATSVSDGPTPSAAGDAACAMDACRAAAPVSTIALEQEAGAGDASSGTTADASVCIPQPGPDLPDDAFTDTNCDGIDGDKRHAIFVAPSGSDSATGAFGDPVQTLAKAVTLAVAASKDVYACNGTYPEALAVSSAVSIYGGYDCANGWQRIPDVLVLAPPIGVPLTVSGVTQPMTIDHAKLMAPDGAAQGESSIAGIVANSASVSFHQVTFQAGAGADGANGSSATPLASAAYAGGDGQSYTDWQLCPTDPQALGCATNTLGGHVASIGGCSEAGGRGGDGWQYSGGAGYPSPPKGPGSLGPTTNATVPGLPGNAGTAGAPAASDVGTFTASGYLPTNSGTDGTSGTSGQGGSGGWGGVQQTPCQGDNFCQPCAVIAGGGGGQGGFGGCGGPAGHGGGGGGASIALLSFHSGVTLTSCTLDTAAAGRGGAPSSGAPGQAGGAGGQGGTGMVCDPNNPTCAACPAVSDSGQPGTAGGAGGKGGAGGPGGGGPSVGLVSVGLASSVDPSVVFNIGTVGAGGPAISGSTNGPDGLTAPTLDLDVSDAGLGQ